MSETVVVTRPDRSSTPRGRRDATWLVAVSAALWGLDGLLRKPLATDLAAGTVVLWEHIIPIVVLAPFLPAAVRAFLRLGLRDKAAVVVIGVGASAVATALFTRAFAIAGERGDFITPLVLQKLQPVLAIALAVLVLGERLRPRFGLYVIPALAGAWLLAFADPTHLRVSELEPALLALGAAALWAAGTVLGRLVSPSVSPRDLTTLRLAFGTVGAFGVVGVTGAPVLPTWGDAVGLVLLALIPGLLALTLYYRALQSTPASRATLAELAFPATAAVVGALLLGTSLTWSQWTGLAVIAITVTAMGVREARASARDRAGSLSGG
ncbi:DMT family transporter [Williamsia serinedens]|uniref:EamA-like transporter family protein n=1 Tax=Williamsia serinedens TaxID=391736 RepID=A0ABT1H2J3_9NOCA|nr:DMT family transporter [Williamsia serinedens]MCP2161459.1 EamA-like transporter family protein [Williamsia serinedens]